MSDEKTTQKFNWPSLFIKIERLSAWIIFLVVIVYGITGYGMTRGLLPRDTARTLHLGWLAAIGLLPFVIHTGWGISLALRRHRLWNRYTRIALIVFYVTLILFFVWAHFFYQATGTGKSGGLRPVDIPSAIIGSGDGASGALDATAAPAVYTADTLRDYDGLDGRPAYAAVDGLVYDFSEVFVNGRHRGHDAGQDLSTAFHSEHPEDYLRGFAVVGTYQE